MKKIILVYLLVFHLPIYAQKNEVFTQQDSLRGKITKERIWWDLQHYKLILEVFPDKKFITGNNTISYKVLKSHTILQIDLQPPLKITKVSQDNQILNYTRNGNVYLIHLKKKQKKNAQESLTIWYEGIPVESKQPPWEGGFTWSKDSNGNPFIATSCQGDGASIWWPCKDHMYDEPDLGMDEYYTIPNHLMAVGNGRLVETTSNEENQTKTFHWKVINPINNYGVNLNIGNYSHFSEDYLGEKGTLNCDYYVLTENLEKAKIQFKQATKTIEALEHWFGPYPFYEDSYKLVEVPFLGMEHQSSVAYGNGYKNGYFGQDLSRTGWGYKFDFIIVHETGHEWFANNITNKDIADMWIHESFTNYSESLYLNYNYGIKAANEYTIGLRKLIANDKPIIGKYNVNNEGSSDMYFKGANMLHTLRQWLNNDEKWRELLRNLNAEFYHKTVTSKEIERFICKETHLKLEPFFDQYLRDIRIPILEYKFENNQLNYRWSNTVKNFKMPLKVYLSEKEVWIKPTNRWKKIRLKADKSSFKVDANFYIETKDVSVVD